MLNTRALALATLAGTVLQVAMVVAGHSNTAVMNLFAVGGMTISLIAGVAYVLLARDAPGTSPIIGALIAGAVCALIGIGVSYALGDVPATLLLFGTASSAATGALGGWITRSVAGRGRVVR